PRQTQLLRHGMTHSTARSTGQALETQKMHIRWITILIVLIIGATVACTSTATETPATPPTTPTQTPTVIIPTQTPGTLVDKSPLQIELDLNRQLWDSKAIERYHFEHRWICFCVADFRALVNITVRDGAIVDVKFVENQENESTVGDPSAAEYYTVVGLFDIIQDAIDKKAFGVTVEYDSEFGYPTDVFIDYDSRMADEERGFMAGNLQTG
ncbi:MAG: DUF6174 domain-containing protein, partial [Chloroflexi bacterium]|nr:DUF6174 domain-containing protein [Chloroflexota bacterium]